MCTHAHIIDIFFLSEIYENFVTSQREREQVRRDGEKIDSGATHTRIHKMEGIVILSTKTGYTKSQCYMFICVCDAISDMKK
jgi:hypothetical protein